MTIHQCESPERPTAVALLLTVMWCAIVPVVAVAEPASSVPSQKTENFDRDPNWDGLNHRASKPRMIKQDFGYSDGKIGGVITIAGEPAYYAKKIATKTFEDTLSASGTLICKEGSGMALIGFFNADTANAWRTRNSVVLRVMGRGERFLAFGEYETQKWRAGSHGFTSNDAARDTIGFPCDGSRHTWSLRYDPHGNNGNGTVEAIIDGRTTVTNLDPGRKLDGASFNRFGLLNVMKHADDPEEIWISDLVINGEKQDLSSDPEWDAHQNRREYETRDDRPYSDYGFSQTQFAGGKAAGELGGLMFRGDVRLPDGINYYGDKTDTLTLAKPLRASGKICFRRGVSDSGTLIGFFHVPTSVTINPDSPKSPRSWTDYVPKNFFGVAVKGPTREGFFFHPTYRLNGDIGGGNPGNNIANCPYLNPDGLSHNWSFEYDPEAANGAGRVTVTLDGQSASLDLQPGHKTQGAAFNRFGIVSTWVDGNGQVIYLDDLVYTARQE